MSDYETQTASKRYQKSLKSDLWGVRDALGGGLGIPLHPWAAQNRKRGANIKKTGKKSRECLKSGQFGRSWLTPGSPIGSDFGCPKGEKCIKNQHGKTGRLDLFRRGKNMVFAPIHYRWAMFLQGEEIVEFFSTKITESEPK